MKHRSTGHRVTIWKQDPCVPHQGTRLTLLTSRIENGPKDEYFRIEPDPEIRSNGSGDFLIHRQQQPLAFDAVHTFAVASQVRTMYQRALRRGGSDHKLGWHWEDDSPLKISIRSDDDLPTSPGYSRETRDIYFPSFDGPRLCEFELEPSFRNPNESDPVLLSMSFEKVLRSIAEVFKPPDGSEPIKPVRINTCQSFDLIAHETGHAVIDGLKKDFRDSNQDPENRAAWEACADLTIIFTILAQMDQCEAIIAHSKADLRKNTFFPALAERFTELSSRCIDWPEKPSIGLRNANNDLKGFSRLRGTYENSLVLTGAVYDVLVKIFHHDLKLEKFDPAETLFLAGRRVTELFICALQESPGKNIHFEHIAANMIRLEKDEEYKRLVVEAFRDREILPKKRCRLFVSFARRLQ